MDLWSNRSLTKISTRNISWGLRRPVRWANLTTYMCRLSSNLGVSNSWISEGLYRPAQGLLYLCLYHKIVRSWLATKLGTKLPCTLGRPYSEGNWLYCEYISLECILLFVVYIIIIIIIIIIIFIYCNWIVTRWLWLVYMYTKYEIDYY
jgi:hypothetical protein